MSPEEIRALTLSFQVATVATLLCLPFALLLGRLLSRGRFPGRALLEAILHLPLVVPPVATGYLLLVLFGRQGPLGRPLFEWFGVTFAFDWKGAVLASAVVGFPLLLRSIQLALEGVDPRLEQAARTLGASRRKVWTSVTLPLARSGILAGCLLAFARSLGEFGATVTLAGNLPGRTQTLPIAVFSYLQQPGRESAAARLVGLSIALSLIALLAVERLARDRSGRNQGSTTTR